MAGTARTVTVDSNDKIWDDLIPATVARTADLGGKADLSGASFSGPVSVPEPTAGSHAATRDFVLANANTGGVSSTNITSIQTLSAAGYAALASPSPNVLYLVTGVGVYVGSTPISVGSGSPNGVARSVGVADAIGVTDARTATPTAAGTARTGSRADTVALSDAVSAALVSTRVTLTETFDGSGAWPNGWTSNLNGGAISKVSGVGQTVSQTGAFKPAPEMLWSALPDNLIDLDVTLRVKLAGGTTQEYLSVCFTPDGALTTDYNLSNGYTIALQPSLSRFFVSRAKLGVIGYITGDVAFTFPAAGTFLNINFKQSGTGHDNIAVTLWADGTTKPGTPTASTLDADPFKDQGMKLFLIGGTGADGTARTFQFDDISYSGAAIPSVGVVTLTETFTAANSAALPAGWTVDSGAAYTGGAGGVVDVQNNQARFLTGAGVWGPTQTAYASQVTAAASDMETYFEFTYGVNAQEYFGVVNRSDGTWAGSFAYNGVAAIVRADTGAITVARYVTGVETVIGTAAWTFPAAGTLVKGRFRTVAGVYSYKLWTGATEPSAWTYTVTDTAPYLAAGKVMITHAPGPSGVAKTLLVDNVTVKSLDTTSGGGGGTGGGGTGTAFNTVMPTTAYTDPTTGKVWPLVWSDDFNTAYPEGETYWAIVDGQFPPANVAYRNKMWAYAATKWNNDLQAMELWEDTGHNAVYRNASTMSTLDGILRLRARTATFTELGQSWTLPVAGTFVPDLPSYAGVFRRIETRYRIVRSGGGGYFNGVLQQINSDHWPSWGELDFPENGSGGWYHHADPANTQAQIPDGGYSTDVWHTYVNEWGLGPGGVPRFRAIIDGVTVFSTTDRVPSAQMALNAMFQCGATGTPPAAEVAEFQFDWMAIYIHPDGGIA